MTYFNILLHSVLFYSNCLPKAGVMQKTKQKPAAELSRDDGEPPQKNECAIIRKEE